MLTSWAFVANTGFRGEGRAEKRIKRLEGRGSGLSPAARLCQEARDPGHDPGSSWASSCLLPFSQMVEEGGAPREAPTAQDSLDSGHGPGGRCTNRKPPPLPPPFGSAGNGRGTSIGHSRATPATRAVLSACGLCCPLGAGPTAAQPCMRSAASSALAGECVCTPGPCTVRATCCGWVQPAPDPTRSEAHPAMWYSHHILITA